MSVRRQEMLHDGLATEAYRRLSVADALAMLVPGEPAAPPRYGCPPL